MAISLDSTSNLDTFSIQNQVHPNYHEFYSYYSELARTVASERSIITHHDISRNSVISEGFIGFESSRVFQNDHDYTQGAPSELSSEISEPIQTRKMPSGSNRSKFRRQKQFVKVEDYHSKSPKSSELYNRRQEIEEADELFQQLKSLVPNTLTITLLQTSIALIKAGLPSELLDMGHVKKEKTDIKREPGTNSVKNKRSFFTLGRNRHIPRLRLIKKKGQFQTKNLLKFDVDHRW